MKGSQAFELEIDRCLSESRKCRSSIRRGVILVLEDIEDVVTEYLKGLGENSGFSFWVVKVGSQKDILRMLEGVEDVKAVVIQGKKLDASNNGRALPNVIDERFPDIPLWVIGNASEKFSKRVGRLYLDDFCRLNDVLGKSCVCKSSD